MPRGGGCVAAVVFSTLKFFISWATRPRPAQVGAALPVDPACAGAALRDASDAPVSREGRKGNKRGGVRFP